MLLNFVHFIESTSTMALLRKIAIKGLCSSKNIAMSCQAVRTHFNRDFMPGPYPKTEEERRAAAKKYGMMPEEYEPYPDDGNGFGDYPKLPDISGESKDPFYNWDFPENKRNFGEPIHVHADNFGEDRWDISKKFQIPYWKQMAMLFGLVGGSMWLYYATFDIKTLSVAVMPRQLPAQGKHYTFEPAE
jgi:NADH dehydrogenase (ubiquinone) 1 beta subcomplex subunit 8